MELRTNAADKEEANHQRPQLAVGVMGSPENLPDMARPLLPPEDLDRVDGIRPSSSRTRAVALLPAIEEGVEEGASSPCARPAPQQPDKPAARRGGNTKPTLTSISEERIPRLWEYPHRDRPASARPKRPGERLGAGEAPLEATGLPVEQHHPKDQDPEPGSAEAGDAETREGNRSNHALGEPGEPQGAEGQDIRFSDTPEDGHRVCGVALGGEGAELAQEASQTLGMSEGMGNLCGELGDGLEDDLSGGEGLEIISTESGEKGDTAISGENMREQVTAVEKTAGSRNLEGTQQKHETCKIPVCELQNRELRDAGHEVESGHLYKGEEQVTVTSCVADSVCCNIDDDQVLADVTTDETVSQDDSVVSTTGSSRAKGSGSDSVVAEGTISGVDVAGARESHSDHTSCSDKTDQTAKVKDGAAKSRGRDRERSKRNRRADREEDRGKKKSLKNAVGDVQAVAYEETVDSKTEDEANVRNILDQDVVGREQLDIRAANSGDVRDNAVKSTCGLESQTITSLDESAAELIEPTSLWEPDQVGEDSESCGRPHTPPKGAPTSRFGKRTQLNRQKQCSPQDHVEPAVEACKKYVQPETRGLGDSAHGASTIPGSDRSQWAADWEVLGTLGSEITMGHDESYNNPGETIVDGDNRDPRSDACVNRSHDIGRVLIYRDEGAISHTESTNGAAWRARKDETMEEVKGAGLEPGEGEAACYSDRWVVWKGVEKQHVENSEGQLPFQTEDKREPVNLEKIENKVPAFLDGQKTSSHVPHDGELLNSEDQIHSQTERVSSKQTNARQTVLSETNEDLEAHTKVNVSSFSSISFSAAVEDGSICCSGQNHSSPREGSVFGDSMAHSENYSCGGLTKASVTTTSKAYETSTYNTEAQSSSDYTQRESSNFDKLFNSQCNKAGCGKSKCNPPVTDLETKNSRDEPGDSHRDEQVLIEPTHTTTYQADGDLPTHASLDTLNVRGNTALFCNPNTSEQAEDVSAVTHTKEPQTDSTPANLPIDQNLTTQLKEKEVVGVSATLDDLQLPETEMTTNVKEDKKYISEEEYTELSSETPQPEDMPEISQLKEQWEQVQELNTREGLHIPHSGDASDDLETALVSALAEAAEDYWPAKKIDDIVKECQPLTAVVSLVKEFKPSQNVENLEKENHQPLLNVENFGSESRASENVENLESYPSETVKTFEDEIHHSAVEKECQPAGNVENIAEENHPSSNVENDGIKFQFSENGAHLGEESHPSQMLENNEKESEPPAYTENFDKEFHPSENVKNIDKRSDRLEYVENIEKVNQPPSNDNIKKECQTSVKLVNFEVGCQPSANVENLEIENQPSENVDKESQPLEFAKRLEKETQPSENVQNLEKRIQPLESNENLEKENQHSENVETLLKESHPSGNLENLKKENQSLENVENLEIDYQSLENVENLEKENQPSENIEKLEKESDPLGNLKNLKKECQPREVLDNLETISLPSKPVEVLEKESQSSTVMQSYEKECCIMQSSTLTETCIIICPPPVCVDAAPLPLDVATGVADTLIQVDDICVVEEQFEPPELAETKRTCLSPDSALLGHDDRVTEPTEENNNDGSLQTIQSCDSETQQHEVHVESVQNLNQDQTPCVDDTQPSVEDQESELVNIMEQVAEANEQVYTCQKKYVTAITDQAAAKDINTPHEATQEPGLSHDTCPFPEMYFAEGREHRLGGDHVKAAQSDTHSRVSPFPQRRSITPVVGDGDYGEVKQGQMRGQEEAIAETEGQCLLDVEAKVFGEQEAMLKKDTSPTEQLVNFEAGYAVGQNGGFVEDGFLNQKNGQKEEFWLQSYMNEKLSSLADVPVNQKTELVDDASGGQKIECNQEISAELEQKNGASDNGENVKDNPLDNENTIEVEISLQVESKEMSYGDFADKTDRQFKVSCEEACGGRGMEGGTNKLRLIVPAEKLEFRLPKEATGSGFVVTENEDEHKIREIDTTVVMESADELLTTVPELAREVPVAIEEMGTTVSHDVSSEVDTDSWADQVIGEMEKVCDNSFSEKVCENSPDEPACVIRHMEQVCDTGSSFPERTDSEKDESLTTEPSLTRPGVPCVTAFDATNVCRRVEPRLALKCEVQTLPGVHESPCNQETRSGELGRSKDGGKRAKRSRPKVKVTDGEGQGPPIVEEAQVKKINVIDVELFPKDVPCIYHRERDSVNDRKSQSTAVASPQSSSREGNVGRKKSTVWKRLKTMLRPPRLTWRDRRGKLNHHYKENVSSPGETNNFSSLPAPILQLRQQTSSDNTLDARSRASPTPAFSDPWPGSRHKVKVRPPGHWRRFKKFRALRHGAERRSGRLPPTMRQVFSRTNYVREAEGDTTSKPNRHAGNSRRRQRRSSPDLLLMERPRDQGGLATRSTPEVTQVFRQDEDLTDRHPNPDRPTVRLLLKPTPVIASPSSDAHGASPGDRLHGCKGKEKSSQGQEHKNYHQVKNKSCEDKANGRGSNTRVQGASAGRVVDKSGTYHGQSKVKTPLAQDKDKASTFERTRKNCSMGTSASATGTKSGKNCLLM